MEQNQEKTSLNHCIEQIRNHRRLACTGLSGSETAYAVARIHRGTRQPMAVIVPSAKDAETMIGDLRFFLESSPSSVLYFPPADVLPSRYIAGGTAGADRIRTLYRMIETDVPPLLVTPVDAVLKRLVPKSVLFGYAELLQVNESVDLNGLIEKLVAGGYVRSIMVEEPGEFSLRGGILDVYCPLYDAPLRAELFGDTVDSLRFFSAESQRTLKQIDEAVLIPAREAILEPEHRNELIYHVRAQAAQLELPPREVRNLVEKIKHDPYPSGIDTFIPMVYPKLDTLFDYLPDSTLVVLSDPGGIEASARSFQARTISDFRSARDEKRFCVSPETLYGDWAAVERTLQDKHLLTFSPFASVSASDSGEPHPFCVRFSVTDTASIRDQLLRRGETDHLLLPLARWIQDNLRSGVSTLLVCRTPHQAQRLKSLLEPYALPIQMQDEFTPCPGVTPTVSIRLGRLTSGFAWPDERIAVITEDEIFGITHRRRGMRRKQVRTDLLTFDELQQADLVVHSDHGIGQYQGLVKLTLDSATNDYLLIHYRDGDRLYLPIERMNVIQKYIGVEGIAPVLAKLGGKSWDSIKDRVKRSAEKIAGELLKLYAARKVHNGYSFGKPDEYFKDFEASFPFEETDDQIQAIEEVLEDMHDSTPMDRLVCGDVGYGKTEVALRASFMAVNNGKQVAMLVPTTVLAEQHLATFSERYGKYPIRIACLSRFRTAREQREIIGGLQSGKIDIVIGTHRLLQKDIVFKDLGLLIVDEEQRFGVKHKEKLKQLRNTLDVLSLTATPIPRTLHMSLTGIRDISVISTPPEHRRPIITSVCEFDDGIIAAAIRNEMERKGQIFFVHNAVHTIDAVAAHLKRLVPEVRLDVAHGQMNDIDLEKVMLRFVHREIDLLVCTTIIESGLDIPSANTILVNRADKYGLAQMYQLRGRVGRADEQAYAYLFIPRGRLLTPDAQKRLKVLMEHSDLGSGFQIAMSDLKIRGGGTLLGAAQSGHIAAVGYDMFLQLMEEAVATLKGEPVSEPLSPEINLPLSAFIPETYIGDIDHRLLTYRRLVKITEIKEISAFQSELKDRFGPLPSEVTNLLLKIVLKVLCQQAGIQKLDIYGRRLVLTFSQQHLTNPGALVKMILSDGGRFEFTADNVVRVNLPSRTMPGWLNDTKNILKEIAQRVSD